MHPNATVVRLTWSTVSGELRAGLHRLGVRAAVRISHVHDWNLINRSAIVAVNTGMGIAEYHWVFYDAPERRVYDPSLTTFMEVDEYFYVPLFYVGLK